METKLTRKNYLIIGSLIFGMFFGAGNLIFPVHLGQLAGDHWLNAAGGFIISGVLLPLMALLAVSITKSNGIYDLARPNGHWYALGFLILIHATLGPLFATPRTATVSFAIGIAPNLAPELHGLALLVYSAFFFGLVYYFSARESSITTIVGKLLNPIFLILLFGLFLLAFNHPMGPAQTSQPTSVYLTNSFANGFLEGYNTMDCLAALAFGITVITAIKQLGITRPKAIALATVKSGSLGILGIALIYFGLIYLGATSLHHFKLAENGGTTLAQIAHYYLGTTGDAIIATMATLACMTTAMGLVVAFSQDFHRRFPKISYKTFLRFNCGLSFLVANLGLDQIIAWSTPMLMFLYPLAITLVLLGMASPLFKNDAIVYRVTTSLTLIPAIFDMVKALPAPINQLAGTQKLIALASQYFPLYDLGFGWVSFGLLGIGLGLGLHWLVRRRTILVTD